jgi:hypothetical protein
MPGLEHTESLFFKHGRIFADAGEKPGLRVIRDNIRIVQHGQPVMPTEVAWPGSTVPNTLAENETLATVGDVHGGD